MQRVVQRYYVDNDIVVVDIVQVMAKRGPIVIIIPNIDKIQQKITVYWTFSTSM